MAPQYFVYPECVFYFPLRQFLSIPAADSFNNRKQVISIKLKNTELFLKFCSIIYKNVLISFHCNQENWDIYETVNLPVCVYEPQNLITLWFSKL